MQATTTFKVGDKVRVKKCLSAPEWVGMEGVIFDIASCLSVAFPASPDGAPRLGWARSPLDRHCWNFFYGEDELVLASAKQPTAFDDLRLTPQAKIVLSHLKKRQRISPAEALTVYGISRLASCIHEIRNRAGYTVKTEQRRDEHGHKYAKYHLAA